MRCGCEKRKPFYNFSGDVLSKSQEKVGVLTIEAVGDRDS